MLLDAVAAHAVLPGPTPEFEFAWRHAAGWMSAVKRLTPAPTRAEGILVVDGTDPVDIDALHAQSLELILRRAGFRTMWLSPAIEPSRLRRALRVLEPSAIVVTATRPSLDAIGRLIYAVRGTASDVAVFDYRGAVPDGGASTVYRLGERPLAARDGLVARLQERLPRGAAAVAPPDDRRGRALSARRAGAPAGRVPGARGGGPATRRLLQSCADARSAPTG